MPHPQSAGQAPDGARLPVGRAVLAGLLLRRFGLLPLLALAFAGRSVPPARRRTILTLGASVYLVAALLLLVLVVVLVGGLALVAFTV